MPDWAGITSAIFRRFRNVVRPEHRRLSGEELQQHVLRGHRDFDAWKSHYADYEDPHLKQRIKNWFQPHIIMSILGGYEIENLAHPTRIIDRGLQCFIIALIQVLFFCPPIEHYIKTNVPTEEEDESRAVATGTPKQSSLDTAFKKMLAMYLIKYPLIICTPILRMFPKYKPGNPHDCEELFRTLREVYLEKKFPQPKGTKTWTCPLCHTSEQLEPQDDDLYLPPETDYFPFKEFDMATLIKYKNGGEREMKTCSTCGETNEGSLKTTYIFGNILHVFSFIDKRIARFEEYADLSPLEPSRESSLWALSGVVWHKMHENDVTQSHYVAIVKHREANYLINNGSYERLPSPLDYKGLSKRYGIPHYGMYYRLGWKETLGTEAHIQQASAYLDN